MNFIIIFADQMHKYALGKIDREISTPNLDRLSDEGILFNNAYSNNPICGPYRGTLLTGLYTSHNKVIYNGDALNKETTSLATQLNLLGYETSFVGKWHLGGNDNSSIPKELRGDFKHFIGYQCYNGFFKDVVFWDEENKKRIFNEHRTEVTTALAIEKLRELKSIGKPFLHVIGYQAPHYPEQPLPEYEKLYKGKKIIKTPDYKEVDPYTPTFSPYSPRPFEECEDYKRYGNDMNEYIRLYNAMVTQVDNGVGEILREVRELGLEDDTLIIFTSDHGDMQGSHGLKNKSLPYEKSCGVPFVVKDPEGIKGKISEELISGIDIYPSLIEYAGGNIDKKINGKSFKGYLRQQKNKINPFIISEFIDDNTGWKMIRDERFKLCIREVDKIPYLLFDMINDPYEMNNLVENEEYSVIKNKLLKSLEDALTTELINC